jgi:hypothetical protein
MAPSQPPSAEKILLGLKHKAKPGAFGDSTIMPHKWRWRRISPSVRLWLSNRAPWVKFFFAKPTCAIAPAPAWRDRSRRNAERSRVAGVPRGSEFGMAVQATPTMRYRSSGKIATPSLLLSGGTATDVRPPFRHGHQSGRVPGSGLSARSAGSRRMMGMRGGSLPMCTSRSANSRNQSLGMAAPTSRQGRLDASDGRRRNNRGSAHGGTSGVAGGRPYAGAPKAGSKTRPSRHSACRMTASFRATATAARLKPTFSFSLRPQRRNALSERTRVSTTVAAS